MRVIVTSPVWSLNGVNIFAANLVRGLRESGVAAELLLTGVTYADSKPLQLPVDIPVDHLPLPAFPSWPARWRALIRYLTSRAPCLYFPNHDFCHSCVSPALSRHIGIVGIAHSDDTQHYEHVRRLGRYWNATVAVSAAIRDRLAEAGVTSSAVIPYGVQLPASVCKRAPRLDSEPLRILYVGRLDQTQKRVLDLAEIAAVLDKRDVRFELSVAGSGPEQERLMRRISALGVSAHVRLLGTVANDEALAQCEQHDVFILPSAFEGLPIALLEAMSRGCVPIVSDVASGIPEIIADGVNGFRVPIGAIDDFADRLALLARTPALREQMSEAARLTISRKYSAEEMTCRYLALFDSIWGDVVAGRFQRASGAIAAPPAFTWRDHLGAPLWPIRRRLRGA